MRDLVYDVEDFILEWWNEDWANTLFQLYDQSTLRRLVGRSTRDEERESATTESAQSIFAKFDLQLAHLVHTHFRIRLSVSVYCVTERHICVS